jgi:hypothetical protein
VLHIFKQQSTMQFTQQNFICNFSTYFQIHTNFGLISEGLNLFKIQKKKKWQRADSLAARLAWAAWPMATLVRNCMAAQKRRRPRHGTGRERWHASAAHVLGGNGTADCGARRSWAEESGAPVAVALAWMAGRQGASPAGRKRVGAAATAWTGGGGCQRRDEETVQRWSDSASATCTLHHLLFENINANFA